MLRRILPLVVVAACHKESPRASGQGTGSAAATPPSAEAPAAAAAPGPAAPPGSAELVAVPADVVSKIQLVEVARGLGRPVALVVAPGDARKRMFVVEQHLGRVRFIENGTIAAKPFLQIKDISDGNEQGLLGLAFHPDFARNGKLYVNYTDGEGATRIVEYTVGQGTPDAVDPASRRELIKIDQPYSNHNGGNLVFGPDGKLWTGMGDGGSAGDPKKNGQNGKALLGKMLRFDVSQPTITAERVHLGVRNPWRFSFDAQTGDLYIADVGQNKWENVYAVPAGATGKNFGWNVVEGNHCFESDDCDKSGFVPPIADYSHDEGCSITGGFVYRGRALPELAGRYFYADYCTGLLRSLRWTSGVVRDHWDWKAALDREGILAQISSFGVDADGELYIVELTGSIYKLARK